MLSPACLSGLPQPASPTAPATTLITTCTAVSNPGPKHHKQQTGACAAGRTAGSNLHSCSLNTRGPWACTLRTPQPHQSGKPCLTPALRLQHQHTRTAILRPINGKPHSPQHPSSPLYLDYHTDHQDRAGDVYTNAANHAAPQFTARTCILAYCYTTGTNETATLPSTSAHPLYPLLPSLLANPLFDTRVKLHQDAVHGSRSHMATPQPPPAATAKLRTPSTCHAPQHAYALISSKTSMALEAFLYPSVALNPQHFHHTSPHSSAPLSA